MYINKVVDVESNDGKYYKAKLIDKILDNGTHKYVLVTVDGTTRIVLPSRIIKFYEIDIADLEYYDLQNR